MTDNSSGGSYAYRYVPDLLSGCCACEPQAVIHSVGADRCSKAALNAASVSMSHDLGKRGMTTVILHPGVNCSHACWCSASVGFSWCACAGWVRTEMTNGSECLLLAPPAAELAFASGMRPSLLLAGGLIDVDQSVSGLLSVIETEKNLNGRMFDYEHEEIGW